MTNALFPASSLITSIIRILRLWLILSIR